MNIVIADDEVLARTVLRHMLKDLNMDINIVGEAVDGPDLIKKMKLHPVDIAFIDIRMPDINGLDSIRILKDSYPATSWVILSGYSKFEYAEEAMELGAVRYLLKPVSPDKLKKTILEITNAKKKSHAAMNIDFENTVLAYFYKLISAEQLKETEFNDSYFFSGGIIYLDSFLDQKSLCTLRLQITNRINKILEESLSSGIYLAYFMLPSSNPVIIFSWNPNKISFAEKTVSNCFNNIGKLMLENRTNNFHPTLILTETCNCFESFCQNIDKVQKLASCRIIIHNHGTLKLDKLINKNAYSPACELEVINLILKLSENYKTNSYLSYMTTLDKLNKIILNERISLQVFVSSYGDFISYGLGINLKKLQDTEEIIIKLKNNCKKMFRYGTEPDDIVSQTINYIQENYMHDISISDISKKLNITPNYLSALFHKKTGETFMKYLTNTRLIKAHELLSEPNTKVNHVAKQVGYNTVNYFTQLYKKQYGYCPSIHSKTNQ